jgi:hypothetical protein
MIRKHVMLAVGTALLAVVSAGGAAAANFRCGVSTVSNNGAAEITDGGDNSTPTPCTGMAGSPAANSLGHTVSASTHAEGGKLSGRSSVQGSSSGRSGFFMGASSSAQVSDTALVGGLGASGALLTFKVLVHGSLASDTANFGFPFNPAASAYYAFRALLAGAGAGNATDITTQACVNNPNSSVSTCNIPGGSLGTNAAIDELLTLSVFAHNGDALTIDLLLRTSTLGYAPSGNFTNDLADFGVNWRGLVFDSASAGLILTSQSGFDYGRPFAAGGVPEPASWALLIGGFGIAGTAARRRAKNYFMVA